MILDPHPYSHQHQNLITSGESHVANTYRVWSTSIDELSCRHMHTHTGDYNTCCASLYISA